MRRIDCVATFVAVTGLCLASCGSNQVCEPGATDTCSCPGGGEGTMTCGADGSGWDPCVCATEASAPPAEGASRASAPEPSKAAPAEGQPAKNQGDPAERALAMKVAMSLLGGWDAGQYEPLGDEFTEEMRSKLPPEAQKQGHASSKAIFGTFQSLNFVEMVPAGPFKAYRFKGDFSKAAGDAAPEVRVVIDDQGKIGGFWCRPWTADIAGSMPGAGEGGQGDQGERELAKRVALRFLEGWDAGRYEPLGDEFSTEMRTKFPPAVQKAGHASTAVPFGAFQSLEFVEMVPLGAMKIYRFRGTFAKAQGDARPEVRVVIDGEGKVGGFFARPWSATM